MDAEQLPQCETNLLLSSSCSDAPLGNATAQHGTILATVAGILSSRKTARAGMAPIRLPAKLRRCAFGALLIGSLLNAAVAWANPRVKFDLPAGDFPTAILEFYHQSKVEVLFLSNDSIKKLRTQPVKGELEPRDALVQLLKGTGLEFEFDSPQSVIIKQPAVVATATPPASVVPLAPPPPVKLAASESRIVSDSAPAAEITVTGSYIHTAIDERAPLVELTLSDFQRAPYPTVQDALYQLPISSLNTPRADFFLNNNYSYGSGIDLRGLGVSATLVLVNGHRQPLSGADGDFVDVSNIPMAAVERIEILPDGASALYGSDAIAGVVNIIMRDGFQGLESHVQYNESPGGRDVITASQLLGTNWSSGKTMLVYEYQDGTDLPASARGYAANADKTAYGGADYRSFSTSPANILNASTLLPIYGVPGNLNGAPLTSSALSSTINLENQFAQHQIFPQRTQHAVYGSASQNVGENIELFAEGRYTKRNTLLVNFPYTQNLSVAANNPYNGLGADETVAFSFGQALGNSTLTSRTRNYLGTFGTRFHFGRDWHGELSESYGRETLYQGEYNIVRPSVLSAALSSADPVTAFNPFGPNSAATLAAIRWQFSVPSISAIETTKAVLDGPLFSLPAGEVKLATGYERRQESLDHAVTSFATPEVFQNARYSRHVNSVFTELLVPVLGDADNPRAPPRLELNLAARYDDYSDFGHSIDPEFRLRWIPLEWLKARASWGKSFRAPKLDDLYDSSGNASGFSSFPDPKSPNGRSVALVMQGDNPDLRQETAKTWTAGFDLVPMFDPKLTLSATYYSIDYAGQIATPSAGNVFDILVQENEWAPVINRNPTRVQIDSICNRADFFGSRASCLLSSPAVIIDDRLANLSTTDVTGIDFNVHQGIESSLGHFDLGVSGSYVLHFDQGVSSSSASTNILNTFANPLKLHFRAAAGWSEYGKDGAGFAANLTANFTNGYSNPGSPLLPHIGSLTTYDVQLGYRIAQDSELFGGIELLLNAVNVFNQSPPFADNMFGYDQSNFQAQGRVLSFSLRKKW
jgi:iron complex outermembrane recepter protein